MSEGSLKRDRDRSDDPSPAAKSSRESVVKSSRRKFQKILTKPLHIVSKTSDDGKKVELSANYFKIHLSSSFVIEAYEATFAPEIEERSSRRKLIQSQNILLGDFIYNGTGLVYTFQVLAEPRYEIKVNSSENVEHTLILEHKRKIDLDSEEALMVMNIIFRRMMNGLDLQLVGRNLYDPKRSIKISEFNLELWPGFITSVRKHEDDMLVCCEVSHRVMRKETAYNVLEEISRRHNNNKSDWQEEFRREIIGSVVLTDYNNRTYRIDEVDFTKSPTSKFNFKGDEVSFGKYYKTKYNLDVHDRNQPLLISNPTKRQCRDGKTESIVLIPELCRMTGLTEKMRANFLMMRKLAEHTQLRPNQRVNALTNFSERIHTSEKCMNVLKGAKMEISREVIKYPGRELKQEEILFGKGKSFLNDDRVDWTMHFRNNEMYSHSRLANWTVVYPREFSGPTRDFVALIQKVARNMNYLIDNPKTHEIANTNNDTYREVTDTIARSKPELIFIIIPSNNAQLYTVVKTVTCCGNAIPSQVVTGKTITPKNPKGLMSIATKVCIQLNCKLGGAPWSIKFPLNGVMTIGYDVTHDTKDKRKSIGAFVASMDLKREVKFYSGIIENKPGEEISSDIVNLMGSAIETYVKRYESLPQRIFFYRDGVGDGQIEYVYNIELERMKNLLNTLRKKYNDENALKFTFVIVNKRIDTRIFRNDGRNFDNPKPGTLVDNTLTLPERYDFYLVSQCVRIGTVAPTLYNVIEDMSGLNAGKLQMLTYKNCHMYFNWTGAVRVPAVVQYAHKLAFLVGQHLHVLPKKELGESGNLYFL